MFFLDKQSNVSKWAQCIVKNWHVMSAGQTGFIYIFFSPLVLNAQRHHFHIFYVYLFIYCITEQIAVLRGHTGLVKGVTWDPVGKYLASQSDDRSVRIWNTSNWQTESVVSKPFEEVTTDS